jgi:hypothetical protein
LFIQILLLVGLLRPGGAGGRKTAEIPAAFPQAIGEKIRLSTLFTLFSTGFSRRKSALLRLFFEFFAKRVEK